MLISKADFFFFDYPLLGILSRIPKKGEKLQRPACMKGLYVSILLSAVLNQPDKNNVWFRTETGYVAVKSWPLSQYYGDASDGAEILEWKEICLGTR